MRYDHEVQLFNAYANFLNEQGFNAVIENCIGPYMQKELLMFLYNNRMTFIRNLTTTTTTTAATTAAAAAEYVAKLANLYQGDLPQSFLKHTFDIFVKNYFGLNAESIEALFDTFFEIFTKEDDDTRIANFLGPNTNLSGHVPPIYSHLDMSLTVPVHFQNIIGYTNYFKQFLDIYVKQLPIKMYIIQMFSKSTPDTIVRDMYILT
jgi:hypothetical protein